MVDESGKKARAISYATAESTIKWAKTHPGRQFPRKVMMVCDMIVAWNDELVSDVEAVVKGLGTLFFHRTEDSRIPVWYNAGQVVDPQEDRVPPPPFLLVGSPNGPVAVYDGMDDKLLDNRIG